MMQLDVPVTATLGTLITALVLASAITWGLRLRRPDGDWTELIARIRSWWVIVIGAAVALLVGEVLVLLVLALVSYLALKEYLSVIPTRRVDRWVMLVAYLAIPIQWYWIATQQYGLFIVWVPVYLFVAVSVVMVLRGETTGFLRSIGTLFWGLMTTVFAIGHMAYIYVLPNEASTGAGLLLMLLILAQGNDVAQYLWGRSVGRHKLAPTVSPNKTVEGFLGGAVTTIALAALIGPLLTPLPWFGALAAGAIIAVVGVFGDLTVSAVKRDLDVKDTGSLIAGHGGILDRVDSLIFAAPLFFHFVRYFYY